MTMDDHHDDNFTIIHGEEAAAGADDFPDHLSLAPFPSTDHLLSFDNPTATVQSLSNDSFRKLKLRPIRCYEAHNLMDSYSNLSTSAAAVNAVPPHGSLGLMASNAEKCSGSRLQDDLGELGFLNHAPPLHQHHFHPSFYGIGNGSGFHQGQAVLPDVVAQVGTGWSSERVDSRLPSTRWSSVLRGDSTKDVTEPVHQTKKKKSRNKVELFLETLVGRVMKKQEEFQNQVIEMIETKEKERAMREEAWKQQVLERAKKEEQLRAEEASRSLALISYIKNVFGHEIKFSSEPQNSVPKDEDIAVHGERDVENDGIAVGNKRLREYEESKEDVSNGGWWNSPARTISSQRWPESEVKALITLRASLDPKFSGTSSTLSIWEAVSAELSNLGYSRSAKKCKEKWENVNKYFRKASSNGNMSSEKAKRRPYFHELEILCEQGFIKSGNACTSKAEVNEEKGTRT